jgi:hypothetical protein
MRKSKMLLLTLTVAAFVGGASAAVLIVSCGNEKHYYDTDKAVMKFNDDYTAGTVALTCTDCGQTTYQNLEISAPTRTEATCKTEGAICFNVAYSYSGGNYKGAYEVKLDVVDHDIQDGTCTLCRESFYSAGLEFELIGGSYSVKTSSNADEKVEIPATYKGLPVTQISYINSNATSISIPETVTNFSSGAFRSATKLKSAYYNGTYTMWAKLHFEDEYSTPMARASVFSCSGGNTNRANFSSSLTEIGDYAFYGFDFLESIDIPDSVTKIGKMSFAYCSGVTNLIIGEGVRSIGESAFAYCVKLSSVTYNAALSEDLNSSSLVFYRAGTDGDGCTFYVGSKVERIPAYLFYSGIMTTNSANLSAVWFLNESVCQSIGDYSFAYVKNLQYAYNLPEGLTSIGESAFRSSGLVSVNFPESLKEIAPYTFADCKSLEWVTIDGIEKISYRAFYNCTAMTTFEVAESVKVVEGYAFDGCTQLTKVTYVNMSGWYFKGAQDETLTEISAFELQDKYSAYTYLKDGNALYYIG